MKQQLLKLIQEFKPDCLQEQIDQKNFLSYLYHFDDLLYRTNSLAHISSSPWIINKERTKVLMVYHNIYQSWSWCGGHADGNGNLLDVALKEAKEETGVKQITPLSSFPIAIDILPVPGHFKNDQYISSHVHLNVTYLCIVDESESLTIKPDENSGVKWIKIEDLENEISEKEMLVVYQKLIKKTKKCA